MSTNRVSPEPTKEPSIHSWGSPKSTTLQQEHTQSEKNEMGGKWQQLLASICSRLDYGAREEIDFQNEILDRCFGNSGTKQESQEQKSSGSSNTANDNMCDSYPVKKPLVILYLSQNSVPFILARSRRKKNAFERILANCVFTEDVWIFTHAQTKDYFKKFKDELKPKNSSFFFFFYTDSRTTKQSLQEISKDMDAFLIFLVKDQEETFYSDEKTSVIAIEDSGKTEAQEAASEDSCKVFDISINISARNRLCELILDIINEKKCPEQKYLQLALSWNCSEKAQDKLQSWDCSQKTQAKLESGDCSAKLEEEKDHKATQTENEGLDEDEVTESDNEGPADDEADGLLDHLMEKALIEDRYEVVRTFMMKGVKISSFLKQHQANLYFVSEENDLFKKLEAATRDKEQGQDKVKKYVEHLLDDITKENKPSSHKETQKDNQNKTQPEKERQAKYPKEPEQQEVANAKWSALCCLRPCLKSAKAPITFTDPFILATQTEGELWAKDKCSALCRLRTRPKPVKAPITFTDKATQTEDELRAKDKDKQIDPRLNAVQDGKKH